MAKVWFITGASRGLGAEIAKGALHRGDRVVATGRHKSALKKMLGADSQQLWTTELDVTDAEATKNSVESAIEHFQCIDVLVNNAGYGHMGFFEELSMEDVHEQFATNFYGALNVTWTVLPHMRVARRGRIFNISSLGGLLGVQLGSMYCASKFALEGWSECLAKELSPFGISITLVEPGPFRTGFLASDSLRFSGKPIADYDERRTEMRVAFEERNGLQPGDPTRLGEAIVSLAHQENPPLRFVAGSVAFNAASAKLAGMIEEFNQWRELSLGTDGNYANASIGGLLRQIK